MAAGSFDIGGFADLEAKLKEFPENIAKRATVRAMRRAATIMADEQKALAPRGPTGNLKDGIRISARSKNLTGLSEYAQTLSITGSYKDAQAALRGARSGGDSDGTRIFMLVGSSDPVAHLVERGTVERFHKSGKSVGVMPAEPFIRPAFDNKKGAVITAVKDELTIEIAKTSARLAKKNG